MQKLRLLFKCLWPSWIVRNNFYDSYAHGCNLFSAASNNFLHCIIAKQNSSQFDILLANNTETHALEKRTSGEADEERKFSLDDGDGGLNGGDIGGRDRGGDFLIGHDDDWLNCFPVRGKFNTPPFPPGMQLWLQSNNSNSRGSRRWL